MEKSDRRRTQEIMVFRETTSMNSENKSNILSIPVTNADMIETNHETSSKHEVLEQNLQETPLSTTRKNLPHNEHSSIDDSESENEKFKENQIGDRHSVKMEHNILVNQSSNNSSSETFDRPSHGIDTAEKFAEELFNPYANETNSDIQYPKADYSILPHKIGDGIIIAPENEEIADKQKHNESYNPYDEVIEDSSEQEKDDGNKQVESSSVEEYNPYNINVHEQTTDKIDEDNYDPYNKDEQRNSIYDVPMSPIKDDRESENDFNHDSQINNDIPTNSEKESYDPYNYLIPDSKRQKNRNEDKSQTNYDYLELEEQGTDDRKPPFNDKYDQVANEEDIIDESFHGRNDSKDINPPDRRESKNNNHDRPEDYNKNFHTKEYEKTDNGNEQSYVTDERFLEKSVDVGDMKEDQKLEDKIHTFEPKIIEPNEKENAKVFGEKKVEYCTGYGDPIVWEESPEFDRIFSEQNPHYQSFPFISEWSNKIFNLVQIYTYKIISAIFGFIIAVIGGFLFAINAFITIWIIRPSLILARSFFKQFVFLWPMFMIYFIRPIFYAFGAFLSTIQVSINRRRIEAWQNRIEEQHLIV